MPITPILIGFYVVESGSGVNSASGVASTFSMVMDHWRNRAHIHGDFFRHNDRDYSGFVLIEAILHSLNPAMPDRLTFSVQQGYHAVFFRERTELKRQFD
jgi:hypothetical protein